MSFVRALADQPLGDIARELIIVAAILLVATLATLVLSGPGQGVPFDTRLDQVPLPF